MQTFLSFEVVWEIKCHQWSISFFSAFSLRRKNPQDPVYSQVVATCFEAWLAIIEKQGNEVHSPTMDCALSCSFSFTIINLVLSVTSIICSRCDQDAKGNEKKKEARMKMHSIRNERRVNELSNVEWMLAPRQSSNQSFVSPWCMYSNLLGGSHCALGCNMILGGDPLAKY